MAVYSAIGVNSFKTQELADISNISPNVVTQNDNAFDAEPSKISTNSGAFFISQGQYGLTPFYGAGISYSVLGPFFGRIYATDPTAGSVDVKGTGFSYDAGLVTQPISRSFGIWNAAFTSSTVTSIVYDTSKGVVVAAPSVGAVLEPRGEISVDIDISESGSPYVDTEIAIYTTKGVAYFSVTGIRVDAFFVADPNWADGISVERRFLTSVFASQSMAETRKVLRPIPSRTLTASIGFYDYQKASMAWGNLRMLAGQRVLYPWYPDQAYMTAANDIRRVYCPSEYRRLSADGYAYIIQGDSFEIVRILEVFTDGFSTKDDIQGSYGVGDFTYPAFLSMAVPEGLSSELFTDNKGSVSVEATELYDEYALPLENASYAPAIKNTLPVFPLAVNFAESPEISLRQGGMSAQSGRGFVQSFIGLPYVVQRVTCLCATKEECWESIGFFNYLKGRGRPFWVISELDFMEISSTDTNVSFNFDTPLDASRFSLLKYLRVTDSTGAYDILAVASIEDDAGDVKVTLPANSLADISSVRQAHAVRLEEDMITEEYLTDSVMVATFTVQELQGI